MTVHLRIVKMNGGKLWHYGHFCHDFLFPVLTRMNNQPGLWSEIRLNTVNPDHRLGTFKASAERLTGIPIHEVPDAAAWRRARLREGLTIDLPAWNMTGWTAGQCDGMQQFIESRFGILDPGPLVILIERGRQALLGGVMDTGNARRHIEDHQVLAKRLKNHIGPIFQNVVLENLPILEQIRLFRRARVIIGQHGAGLCNAAWNDHLDGRTTVIELRPQKSPTFVNICRAVNARHLLLDHDFDRIVSRVEEALTIATNGTEPEPTD